MRFSKIPKVNGFVKKEPRTTHTSYIQNPMTGEMEGRIDLRDESPPKGMLIEKPDDSTGVLRVHEPFTVGKKKYEPGEIVGRLPKKGRIPLRLQKRANQKKYFASRRRR